MRATARGRIMADLLRMRVLRETIVPYTTGAPESMPVPGRRRQEVACRFPAAWAIRAGGGEGCPDSRWVRLAKRRATEAQRHRGTDAQMPTRRATHFAS